MKQFTGTKTILARPMTLGEYNDYRGWDKPEDEDGSSAGYLVEYTDGGEPNHPDHKGYISWSPKDVFERSYAQSGTHVDRMLIEHAALENKIQCLTAFLGTPKFGDLPFEERGDIEEQHGAMIKYREHLASRIERASPASTTDGEG